VDVDREEAELHRERTVVRIVLEGAEERREGGAEIALRDLEASEAPVDRRELLRTTSFQRLRRRLQERARVRAAVRGGEGVRGEEGRVELLGTKPPRLVERGRGARRITIGFEQEPSRLEEEREAARDVAGPVCLFEDHQGELARRPGLLVDRAETPPDS